MNKRAVAQAEGEKQKDALSYILYAIVNDPAIPYYTKINSVIALGSATCAIIAVQPIPFADIFILTPVQMVMIYYIAQVIMGEEVQIDTTSLLTTLAAVAGWGLIAQQIILGLYKTVLPFMGGFTTIPLVYGATSAIGYMAVHALEQKAKNKDFDVEKLTPQQKAEFDQITKQAKADAKKNKPSLDELKDFVANAKTEAKAFYVYEQKLSDLEKQNQALQHELTQKELAYKKQRNELSELDDEFAKLEDEQLELMLQNETLNQENKTLLEKCIIAQEQLNKLKKQAQDARQSKKDFLQNRMTVYSNVVFEKDAFDEFVLLTNKDARLAEKLIGLLNYVPDKAQQRCKVAGTDFLEYGFGSQGRLYVKRVGGKYYIYKIGNKATQPNDIKYLKTL